MRTCLKMLRVMAHLLIGSKRLSSKTRSSGALRRSMRRSGRWEDPFGQLRCRCAVDHGVCILDAHSISTEVCLDNVHHRVISVSLGPITLPFEHGRERGHRFRSGLDNAFHGVVMVELTHVTATILDYVNFIAIVNGLN